MMNIFITGGLTGLGRELAENFAAEGHQVGICSFQKEADVKNEVPSGISYYSADVRDKDKMRQVINEFAQQNGSLDIIYANAGINHPKLAIPDWDRGLDVIDINIKGVVNTVAPAIEIMKEQKSGQIVTIASISAYAGLPGMSIYGSTKAFIKNFSESLCIDLRPYGINVTMVAPGFIHTPLTKDNNHKMPFVIEQSTAVKEIKKAIIQKRPVHIFPYPMKFVARFLYHLPRGLYRFIMGRDLTGLKAGGNH
jgi:short-subunit dehydrogenase